MQCPQHGDIYPNGKVCPFLLVISATVGELEVEGGLGNTTVQQESQ